MTEVKTVTDRELLECPACARQWPAGCEQAVSVEMFGECIVCRFIPGGAGSGLGTEEELAAIAGRAAQIGRERD